MSAVTWLTLALSNVYSIGLGVAGSVMALVLYRRPQGWEWVPDGLLADQRTVWRRAVFLALLWPVAVPALYVVARQAGLPADPIARRVAAGCFVLAVLAGVAALLVLGG